MGIREIAKEAKVSIATVSRVLNTPELVNEDTKNKVLQIAKQQKYKKLNNFLFETDVQEIAVIIPNTINSFFSRILQGINEEAQKFDLIVNLYLTNDDIEKEKEAIEIFIKKRIKGLILIRAKNEDENSLKNLEKLDVNNIPLILVDRDLSNSNYSGIFLSNANAVYESINKLIKDNYKKIAVLIGEKNSLNSKQRFEGYKKALLDNGILFDKQLILSGDFSIESAYDLTLTLLKKDNLPDVIFSFTNELTIGCIKAIRDKNPKLLEKIKIFSFNKLDTTQYSINFDISYIEHKTKLMGKKSVTILKNKLVGTKGTIREILDYEIKY